MYHETMASAPGFPRPVGRLPVPGAVYQPGHSDIGLYIPTHQIDSTNHDRNTDKDARTCTLASSALKILGSRTKRGRACDRWIGSIRLTV
jgi:hypothetical protein